jgi:hypothetical protein
LDWHFGIVDNFIVDSLLSIFYNRRQSIGQSGVAVYDQINNISGKTLASGENGRGLGKYQVTVTLKVTVTFWYEFDYIS